MRSVSPVTEHVNRNARFDRRVAARPMGRAAMLRHLRANPDGLALGQLYHAPGVNYLRADDRNAILRDLVDAGVVSRTTEGPEQGWHDATEVYRPLPTATWRREGGAV